MPLDNNGSPMYDVMNGIAKDAEGLPLRVARYAGADESDAQGVR